MKSKKILIFSYYFPPTIGGGIFRVLRFIKYMPRNGWMPMIVTPKKSYVAGENVEAGKKILATVPSDIKIERTRTCEILSPGRRRLAEIQSNQFGSNKARSAKFQKFILLFMKKCFSKALKAFLIPDEVIGWVPFALVRGRKIIKREDIDVIYTTSPPASVHIIGLLLKKLVKKIWVADFRDPWTQRVDFGNHSFIRKTIELFLERSVVKNADLIITTTSAISAYFKYKYPVYADKVETITNGYDPDDFIKAPDCRLTDKFTITHTGYLFGHRDPLPFMKAILSLVCDGLLPRDDLEIRFIGYTDKGIERIVRDNAMDDIVKFRGYASRSEVITAQKESSVLLLVTDPRGAIQIPGKLFEYIFSERPILCLSPAGVCSNIIKETDSGHVSEVGDIEQIANIIAKFYKDFRSGALKVKPVKSEIKKYDVSNLTAELCEYLSNCASPKNQELL